MTNNIFDNARNALAIIRNLEWQDVHAGWAAAKLVTDYRNIKLVRDAIKGGNLQPKMKLIDSVDPVVYDLISAAVEAACKPTLPTSTCVDASFGKHHDLTSESLIVLNPETFEFDRISAAITTTKAKLPGFFQEFECGGKEYLAAIDTRGSDGSSEYLVCGSLLFYNLSSSAESMYVHANGTAIPENQARDWLRNKGIELNMSIANNMMENISGLPEEIVSVIQKAIAKGRHQDLDGYLNAGINRTMKEQGFTSVRAYPLEAATEVIKHAGIDLPGKGKGR